MIGALIQGELATEATERAAANGNRYWTASARVAAGSDSVFMSITTFDTQAGERLAALRKGSSFAAAGVLEATTWTDKAGAERKGWRLLAREILTVYQARKRREPAEVTA